MTLEEFRRLADTWGGDIERWPDAVQGDARRLAGSGEAREILASARRLDRVLAVRPHVSRRRAERAAHAVTMRLTAEAEHSTRSRWSWDFSGWLVPAASVACSVVLGVTLALSVPYGGPRDEEETVVLGLILDNSSLAAGWEIR